MAFDHSDLFNAAVIWLKEYMGLNYRAVNLAEPNLTMLHHLGNINNAGAVYDMLFSANNKFDFTAEIPGIVGVCAVRPVPVPAAVSKKSLVLRTCASTVRS